MASGYAWKKSSRVLDAVLPRQTIAYIVGWIVYCPRSIS